MPKIKKNRCLSPFLSFYVPLRTLSGYIHIRRHKFSGNKFSRNLLLILALNAALNPAKYNKIS